MEDNGFKSRETRVVLEDVPVKSDDNKKDDEIKSPKKLDNLNEVVEK